MAVSTKVSKMKHKISSPKLRNLPRFSLGDSTYIPPGANIRSLALGVISLTDHVLSTLSLDILDSSIPLHFYSHYLAEATQFVTV